VTRATKHFTELALSTQLLQTLMLKLGIASRVRASGKDLTPAQLALSKLKPTKSNALFAILSLILSVLTCRFK